MAKKISIELPKQISLMQAIYWIGFDIEPVEEKTLEILVRPEVPMNHPARSTIVQLLFEGKIGSKGVPGDLQIIEDKHGRREIISAMERPNGQHIYFDIPSELWDYEAVEFDRSILVTGWAELAFTELLFPTYEAYEDISEELGKLGNPNWEAKNMGVFSHIMLSTKQLRSLFFKPERQKTGRKPAYDWAAVFEFLAEDIFVNGIPKTKTKFVETALDWCQKEWGDNIPSQRQMFEKIGPLFDRLRNC